VTAAERKALEDAVREANKRTQREQQLRAGGAS
jgi:hypothetical protein